MEKNGGSCAGKQRFHVFVTASLSTCMGKSRNVVSGAVVAAPRLCAAGAPRRQPGAVVVGRKREGCGRLC